jgi:hypothetical protein
VNTIIEFLDCSQFPDGVLCQAQETPRIPLQDVENSPLYKGRKFVSRLTSCTFDQLFRSLMNQSKGRRRDEALLSGPYVKEENFKREY